MGRGRPARAPSAADKQDEHKKMEISEAKEIEDSKGMVHAIVEADAVAGLRGSSGMHMNSDNLVLEKLGSVDSRACAVVGQTVQDEVESRMNVDGGVATMLKHQVKKDTASDLGVNACGSFGKPKTAPKGFLKTLGFGIEMNKLVVLKASTRTVPTRGPEIECESMKAGDVYVGTNPKLGDNRWRYKFNICAGSCRQACVENHMSACRRDTAVLGRIDMLTGKRLRCHCPSSRPCHVDNLVEIFKLVHDDFPAVQPDRLKVLDELEMSLKRWGPKIRLLYLFSGPSSRSDGGGFDQVAEKYGVQVDMIDTDNGESEYDLRCQHVWGGLQGELADGKYDGMFASPPCSTFSRARTGGTGPRTIRGEFAPDIYGLKGISIEEAKRVKEGTLLAFRARDAMEEMIRQDKPAIIETPARQDGFASVFKLPEFLTLVADLKAHIVKTDQCMFGSRTKKPTEFIGTNVNMDILRQSCDHPVRAWRGPKQHDWRVASHPLLRGTQLAVPASQWQGEVKVKAGAPWVTRSVSAYPPELNHALVVILVHSAGMRLERDAG